MKNPTLDASEQICKGACGASCQKSQRTGQAPPSETAAGPSDALNSSMAIEAERRRPVLIAGSGLLHQCNFGPFADWTNLLHEVAHRLRVPFDELHARAYPTLFWESMLVDAASATGIASHKHEPQCLSTVCEVIRRASQRTVCKRFRELAESRRLHAIINLNFTAVPLTEFSIGPSQLAEGEIVHFQSDVCTIWCPHGHYSRKRSICISVRKYAALLGKLENLRREYHKHRKQHPDKTNTSACPAGVGLMRAVFEHPLVFAGCGLSHSEWTVWWLLATKARNQARHSTVPSIFVTATDIPPDQDRALERLHCQVKRVETHSAVWDTAEALGA